MTTLIWLRDDLRLADNPALHAAVERGEPVLLVYILDEVSPGIRPLGGAVKWWLHESLSSLSARVAGRGGRLLLRRGAGFDVIRELLRETKASAIFWNRRYGLAERTVDTAVKEYAHASGIEAESFAAHLLFEPWMIRTGSNTPYTVFTPFWKACLSRPEPPRAPLPDVTKFGQHDASLDALASDELGAWQLQPSQPDWAMGLRNKWKVGEPAAVEALEVFVNKGLPHYGTGRDFPAQHVTSELSPHLRFGEISPHQIWHRIEQVKKKADAPLLANAAKFLSEVGWREFSYNLLFHWPELATVNFDRKYDSFPWLPPEPEQLAAWREGRTGIPLVDAGMRELWQTGTMHNRVRMVAASFLIKNLLIDWRVGEAWFWDTLVDADPASNAASWQWVAGSGADAAPYFRVFNPLLQAEKFDPQGIYLKRYLGDYEMPMLSGYPEPIVDVKESRDRALAALKHLEGVPRQIDPPHPFEPSEA